MKRTSLFFIIVLLVVRLPLFAEGSANSVTNKLPPFEEAEAWNIRVEETFKIPEDATRPAFSHDFKRLAYCYAQNSDDEGLFLAIRSLENWTAVKKIKLPAKEKTPIWFGYFAPHSIVWSPDDKKIAVGPVTSPEGTNTYFIDLQTSKITGVNFNANYGELISWPVASKLYVGDTAPRYGRVFDLDTLSVSDLTDRPKDSMFNDSIHKHKNCVLRLNNSDLVVSGTHYPYTKVLFPKALGATTAAYILWTPDLRYVVFNQDSNFGPKTTATLLKLGTCSTLALNFEIKGLDQSLTPEQLQLVKSAFADGKRIWASVFDARINPLNDKLIGPDESKFKGQGYLTQIEPGFKFKYTYEVSPAQLGNILSRFLVENGWQWDNKVWGELSKVCEDTDFKPTTVRTVTIEKSVSTAATSSTAEKDARVFELRTYVTEPGKLADLNARFRDHTCKLFEKHGMENIGYWVPLDADKGADNTLIYVIAHQSRDAAKKSWAAFGADPDWQAARKKSEEGGKILAKAPESVFMSATDYSAAIKPSAGGERVFELRTYTTELGRLPNLQARFRDHTCKLFEKHGMMNIGYWTPQDADKGADNTLIYILAHKSRDAAKDSFGAFGKDPAWQAARKASEEKAGGSLTVKGGVKSVFMKVTDYSPIK